MLFKIPYRLLVNLKVNCLLYGNICFVLVHTNLEVLHYWKIEEDLLFAKKKKGKQNEG